MENLFLQVLNMSLVASVVIVVVLLLRLPLKKAPKSISYALWSVVLFRLICPFSFESFFSLLPSAKPLPQEIITAPTPVINSGFPILDMAVQLPAPAVGDSINPMQALLFIAAIVWIIGVVALLIYSVISYVLLKHKVKIAMLIEGNIYECDTISSPFVLGLLKPKIYLPLGLSATQKTYILKHEQTHVKRFDTLIKPLAFLTLCVHWFNPLCWVAFVLMSKDMELSCDEAVIKAMGNEIKHDYSTSLLSLATKQKMLSGSPLAFGESNIKARIKNVLNYKKPAIWVIVISAIAIVAVGVGLMTNPVKQQSTTNGDISSSKSVEYFIMTDEIGAIGCEYGINKNNELDTLQMLAELEKLQGFSFDSDWASHGYVKLSFQEGIKPKSVFLRYCASVDDIWQQEYPIDSDDYRIKVPPKAGIYSFFADITWGNGEKETAYFNMNVATLKTATLPLTLTKETASEFINQTLSSFMLSSDNTVSFKLPAVIPTSEDGKTKLFISSSATFAKDPSTNSMQEILDWKDGWQGGDTYSQKLEMERGTLTRLFLRVAFETQEGGNAYRNYAVNYIELMEPFQYDKSATIENRRVEINEVGTASVLNYTQQNGDSFSITLTPPKGLTLSISADYPEYEMPTIVLNKNNAPIGTLTLSGFGTDDINDLKQIDTSKNELPMAIFSPIALSNHAEFKSYKVIKVSATSAIATAEYLWQDLTDYGGRAPDAPWLKADSILAFDYEKIPYSVYFNLADGALNAVELESLASSIVISK